jgi:hypothetical protein
METTKNYNSTKTLKIIVQYIVCGLFLALSIKTYFEERKILASILFLVCGIYLLPILSQKLKSLMPFLNDWLWRRILFGILFFLAIYSKL